MAYTFKTKSFQKDAFILILSIILSYANVQYFKILLDLYPATISPLADAQFYFILCVILALILTE